MQLGKYFTVSIIFLFLAVPAHAQANYKSRHLTVEQIQRVKAFKELTSDVDKKPLWETVEELEKTRKPWISLEMREAMAKAYSDIVKDYNVEGQDKKEWLYSMVCLNMAYLQFGGAQRASSGTTSLNKLILQKLRQYLPSDVLKEPGFLYSLS